LTSIVGSVSYASLQEGDIMSTPSGLVGFGTCSANGVAPGAVTDILVVDDSAFDRELVGRLLGSMAHVRTLFAKNGREALAQIERQEPAIVITDLIMPEMDGLELVHQVRSLHPRVFVILMTAHGSEDVAMQALRAGAANYIPKKNLVRDLVQTVRKVLALAISRNERRRVLTCLVRRESALKLPNDPDLIIPLVTLLHEELESVGSWDSTALLQMCVALQEALANAMYHGNLEVSSELREDGDAFDAQADERRKQDPYRSRRVRVHAQVDRDAARFLVADDGPGYDTAILNRPIEPDDLNRLCGRGLLLIRTFMDQVSFNKTGNEIRMVKLGSPG
jgi:CheY-like chemotaxis protein/anti-sigma regulatory factor (Ser/Thr protein kinase)